MSSLPDTEDPAHQGNHLAVNQSPEFAQLRRTFRRFVFPLTAIFLIWYFLFVLLSNYASDFMSRKVIGNIHLGLIFGLLQFASTFLITMLYARWADRKLDPMADELAARVTGHDVPEVAR
ncbi:MAG: DUF485 domain-containing protein [Actinomycetota bacterium]